MSYFRKQVISAYFDVLHYWLEEPEEIEKIISDMAFEGPMQVSSIKEQIMRIN